MEEELDGCEIDFNDYIIEDDDPELFALFPEGKDEETEVAWKELFGE